MWKLVRDFLWFVKRIMWTRSAQKFLLKNWNSVDYGILANSMLWSQHVKPFDMMPWMGKALLVSTHVDDVVFAAWGTVLSMARRNIRMRHLLMTQEPRKEVMDVFEIVNRRISVHPVFFNHPVGSLGARHDIIAEQIGKQIVEFKPAAVFVPAWWDAHEDHRAIAACLPEGDYDIWFYQVYGFVPGNVIVPVTYQYDKKLDDVKLFSDLLNIDTRNWLHVISGKDAYCSRFYGLGGVNYIEMFLVISREELSCFLKQEKR